MTLMVEENLTEAVVGPAVETAQMTSGQTYQDVQTVREQELPLINERLFLEPFFIFFIGEEYKDNLKKMYKIL